MMILSTELGQPCCCCETLPGLPASIRVGMAPPGVAPVGEAPPIMLGDIWVRMLMLTPPPPKAEFGWRMGGGICRENKVYIVSEFENEE